MTVHIIQQGKQSQDITTLNVTAHIYRRYLPIQSLICSGSHLICRLNSGSHLICRLYVHIYHSGCVL
jgi:hypothetical protein